MRYVPLSVSLTLLLVASAVILGWVTPLDILTQVRADWPPMTPAGSVAFFLAGLSLALQSSPPVQHENHSAPHATPGRLAGIVFASGAALIGIARLAEIAGIGSTGTLVAMWAPASAPRMAPAVAANFVMLGTALALVSRPTWVKLAQALAIIATFLTWFGLSRYLYGAEAPALPPSMPIHTAALFLLLSIAILCLAPQLDLLNRLTRNTAGGVLTRYLLPAAILVPPAIAWLTLYVQRIEVLATPFATALFALLGVVLFASLVWVSAERVDRLQEENLKARRALLAGEERTRLILQNAPDAVISINAEGRVTACNPLAETLFGWPEAEFLGQTLAETIVPHRYREAHRQGLERYVRTGVRHILSDRIELFALTRGGKEFPIEITITRIDSDEGVEFSAFIRDITQRKAAEAHVRAQVDRLTLLDRITRAITEQQELASIFQAVLGSLEADLAVDFACFVLFDPLDQSFIIGQVGPKSEALARELQLTAGAKLPVEDGLARCLRGEFAHDRNLEESKLALGKKLAGAGLASLVVAPLRRADALVGGLLAARAPGLAFSSTDCEFLRQLSENVAVASHQAQLHAALKRAYEEVRETHKTLMQQERLRAFGQMASGVAHDINNALSPASLAIGLVLEQEKGLSAEGRENLEVTAQAIENAAQTIVRMREFYRRRGEEVSHEPVDLNRAIEAALALTRVRWRDIPQKRGIVFTLRRDLAPALPMINAAESEVRDALTNLILNAIDSMPEGGAITVRSAPLGTRVIVEVIDSGVGMDELTRQRCIEPFFTTKGERGTGLGLAMVYGMSQRHHAALEIESVPGQGTSVRLSFPLAEGAPVSVQPVAKPALSPPRRILLIDDDPEVLRALHQVLERDGHDVTTQDRPEAGVALFRERAASPQPFDIVITDLGMPHMDGHGVAAAIKAASARTPVILLTGWGHELDLNTTPLPHVARVLSKPPKLAELRRALVELLSSTPA